MPTSGTSASAITRHPRLSTSSAGGYDPSSAGLPPGGYRALPPLSLNPRSNKKQTKTKTTSLKIFKHYKLKPSFSIIKDEKDKVGVGDKPPPTSFNNLIKFDPIWSSLIQFDQVWSNLNRFDPIWSSLIQFNPIWSNLIKFDAIYSNLIKFDQFDQVFDPFYSTLFQFDQVWSNLIQFEPIWSNLNQFILF